MSRELAMRVAREQRADIAVVMATIEAETNFRNVVGGYGRPSALWGAGYGQVHPAWHADDVRDVARRLGVTLPADFGQVPWRSGDQVWHRYARGDATARAVRQVIDTIIIRNSEFSMQLSVQVIRKKWDGAGRDFDRFLRSYVGPAIPAADIARRKAMLERWRRELGQAPAAPALPQVPRFVATPEAKGVMLTGPGLAGIDPRNLVVFAGAAGVALIVLWQRGQLADDA